LQSVGAGDGSGNRHLSVAPAKYVAFTAVQIPGAALEPLTQLSHVGDRRPPAIAVTNLAAQVSNQIHPSSFNGQSRVPDLRHVPNLIAVELHHVHIVRRHVLAGGCARTTLSGNGLLRRRHQQKRFPVRCRWRTYVRERLSLSGEGRTRLTVLSGSVLALPRFARLE
jgi:hypothetical protein